MILAKSGDTVRVHYTGTLDDGTIFDKSVEPLQFTLGAGQLIDAFEQAVEGMSPGDTKTINAPMAYGPRQDDLLMELDRKDFPQGARPEVGQMLQMEQPGDHSVILTVIAVSETSVTLDANHPLAGLDLNFEIKLLEIVE